MSAFAVVTTAHELGLSKTPPLPPPPPTPSSPTTTAATAGDAKEEPPVALRSSRLGSRWGYRGGRKTDLEGEEEEEEEDQGGAWGETAAIGGRVAAAGVRVTTASPPRSVMQGFLRKRAAARSWGSSGVWEYRWVVLRVSRGSERRSPAQRSVCMCTGANPLGGVGGVVFMHHSSVVGCVGHKACSLCRGRRQNDTLNAVERERRPRGSGPYRGVRGRWGVGVCFSTSFWGVSGLSTARWDVSRVLTCPSKEPSHRPNLEL